MNWISLKLWFLLIFLFIIQTFCAQQQQHTVTNEDIRDAILQVVNVVRTSEDKLERHEYRARFADEQLKKGMISIDKRIKMLDPFKGTVNRLDERLADVETILMQKDERERIQLQRTFDTVEDIHKNLPIIVEKLKNDIIEKISKLQLPPTAAAKVIPTDEQEITKKDFNLLEKNLNEKLVKVTNTINSMENDLNRIKLDNQYIREIHNKSNENLDKVKRQLSTSEQLLEKYENKLAEYNNRIPQILPTNNFNKEQIDWQTNFMQALNKQKTHVEEILSDIKTISDKVNKLPNKMEFENVQNQTLETLEEIKYETIQQPIKSITILDDKFKNIEINLNKKHEETLKSINEMSEITESLTENFSKSHEQLRNDIQSLTKIEQVMVQTADGVLDTKRRVEYGIHQILAEFGQLIKQTTKDINTNINERFDLFELSVLDEDSGALANLTAKIGQEIDQVWRQIGIMHQQMSASTDTLNKLQNQTDAYVNGSLDVMDNMKGKVGKITGRITEVDENLNFLLGKLSLVTQEFNQIKSGLGKALDEMRATFKTVEKKIKDPGPGPHEIPSNEIIDEITTPK